MVLMDEVEMVLMDEEGCKIHASVKETLVSEFDSKLEQGQSYYLSDFGVTERKAKHHVVAHEYRINFYHITKVDNCDDIGGSLFGFDFRPFESVRSEVQPSTVAYAKILTSIGGWTPEEDDCWAFQGKILKERRAIKACSETQAKLDELEKELSNLVGLNELKLLFQKWAKEMLLYERRKALGLKVGTPRPPHMALHGNLSRLES
nr:AAA-type ATPase family protein/ankyrin repeat protein [Tanacetum cinerariifolium]GEX88905.1 AAA-type ATPase family protein/ankyrin repeat protein [Tanacetum cinerariifolium]